MILFLDSRSDSVMPEEKDMTSTTVLVVDDSETDRTLVTGLLTTARPEWTVLSVSAAAEGLEVLARQSITAVVADLFMPEMSGEEFLLEVCREFPFVPVMLITSLGNDEIAARSLELGAANYLPKNRLADDLVPAVDEILREIQEAAVARDVLSHLVRSQTVFRIDSDLEQIRLLLHLIRDQLQTLQRMQGHEVRQVTDAVREALMNAYTHGSQVSTQRFPAGSTADVDSALVASTGSPVIEVELSFCADRVCFSITDEGSGFDTNSFHNGVKSKTGHGFCTMRRHMDCIEFNERGNRISLTKELTPPTAV